MERTHIETNIPFIPFETIIKSIGDNHLHIKIENAPPRYLQEITPKLQEMFLTHTILVTK